MCLMGVDQILFLACENTQVMKYIIPENIFDITNIWSWAHMRFHLHIAAYYHEGGAQTTFGENPFLRSYIYDAF